MVIDFCMKSCDILASGSVWGHFFIDFGCLGRPWGDFGRSVSTFDRFLLVWGVKMGALGTLNGFPGRSWAYFCDPSDQK